MIRGKSKSSLECFLRSEVIQSTPEAVKAEVNAANAALEYANATSILNSLNFSLPKEKGLDVNVTPQYDAKLADEAYTAGCAALAAGKLNEALHLLNISLSKCPPEKTVKI